MELHKRRIIPVKFTKEQIWKYTWKCWQHRESNHTSFLSIQKKIISASKYLIKSDSFKLSDWKHGIKVSLVSENTDLTGRWGWEELVSSMTRIPPSCSSLIWAPSASVCPLSAPPQASLTRQVGVKRLFRWGNVAPPQGVRNEADQRRRHWSSCAPPLNLTIGGRRRRPSNNYRGGGEEREREREGSTERELARRV